MASRASRGPEAPGFSARPPLPILTLALCAGIDLGALALPVLAGSALPFLLGATALHALAALTIVLLRKRLPGSGCTLAVALILTLPVVGVVLVALALGTTPQAALNELAPVDADERELPDRQHVRRIAAALPACEMLMAATIDDRRATLAALARRGDANAVSLLRWVISTGGEMAVEGALALDELGTGFDSALAALRDEMAVEPSEAIALDGAMLIARALESGIVEPTMMEALATEARGYLLSASDSTRQTLGARQGGSGAAIVSARLELAAMQPASALAILDQELSNGTPKGVAAEAMRALRTEARLRSHTPVENSIPSTALPRFAAAISKEGALDVRR
ncbi:MAG TPA: hypothetical protein VH374_09985 [Polyangia bacterium]|jgi:hypothetical protein|nr:hypothetical protein [Polyangia bacterium]